MFLSSLILRLEFSCQSYQNGRLPLIGYCTDCVQRVIASGKKIVVIQDLLNPILVSLRLTLVSSGDASYYLLPSKPTFQNVIMMKLGRLKGDHKKLQIE